MSKKALFTLEGRMSQNGIRLEQRARWLPADMETPISLFLGVADKSEGILLESAEVDGRWGRYSVLAADMALYIYCRAGLLELDIRDERLKPLAVYAGEPFVEGLRKLMAAIEILPPENMPQLPPITRALYGWLGFGMAVLFNPKLKSVMPLNEAQCQLALPGTVLLFDHVYKRLCQISLGEHRLVHGAHASSQVQENISHSGSGALPAESEALGKDYRETVCKIRDLLRQGEAIQVVPSVRFSLPFDGDPFMLYRRMRRDNASPYMFFMRFPEITLFGSSPELMVRCSAGRLELAPIAGTRRRGRDDAEDAALAAELSQDPKERAEHVMLVDLGRNDLGRVAKPGSVKLERFMEVERFSHVMHLTSRIGAQLDNDPERPLDALDVLAATFPAGTVSGAPKIRAMEIIRGLEGLDRGPYAGCIGWIGLDKGRVDLDMGITIRSMWLKAGRLYWQAGGGIVHDSDPNLEWKEVCNKSAIMRQVLEDSEHVSLDR